MSVRSGGGLFYSQGFNILESLTIKKQIGEIMKYSFTFKFKNGDYLRSILVYYNEQDARNAMIAFTETVTHLFGTGTIDTCFVHLA